MACIHGYENPDYCVACCLASSAYQWYSIEEIPSYGFCWVWNGKEVLLGYWMGQGFQEPETVGDREGLSVEMIPNVVQWHFLDMPPCPKGN